MSPSDISFDKTDEDLEVSYLRSGKKWKRSLLLNSKGAIGEDDELHDTVAPPFRVSIVAVDV